MAQYSNAMFLHNLQAQLATALCSNRTFLTQASEDNDGEEGGVGGDGGPGREKGGKSVRTRGVKTSLRGGCLCA